jgi:hypothetical protein
MSVLLFNFSPHKIPAAPAMTVTVVNVRPTNSRRVIRCAERNFAEGFIDVPSIKW